MHRCLYKDNHCLSLLFKKKSPFSTYGETDKQAHPYDIKSPCASPYFVYCTVHCELNICNIKDRTDSLGIVCKVDITCMRLIDEVLSSWSAGDG